MPAIDGMAAPFAEETAESGALEVEQLLSPATKEAATARLRIRRVTHI
jgi:hypothetical protein